MTTATLPASLVTPRAVHRDPLGRRYGRRWARVPRELGYLALTTVIGLVALTIAGTASNVGGGPLIVLGVLLLALILLGSRYLGAFELTRLGWARTPAITPPRWARPFHGRTPLRALGDIVANGHYWLYGLHSAMLNPLLAFITVTAWLGWLVAGVSALTFPLWGQIVPFDEGGERIWVAGGAVADAFVANGRTLADALVWFVTRQDDPAVTAWWVGGIAALGLLLLALLPFVTRAATLAHWGLGRLLLSRFPSEGLRQDVARVDAARLAAVAAEDTAIRRLERDIHDGPQQRLLRLQMELATAERRLTDSPEAAESVAAARRLAAETLDELRALAQGYAPPLLQDRGLSAALGALGRRGTLPVETAIAITGPVPDPVERSVYFIAAELTTNAIKHSGASRVRVEARTQEDESGHALRLVVRDDGRGGAQVLPGGGLAGAVERVAGLGGSLTIESPAGGPTTVEVRVPLR